MGDRPFGEWMKARGLAKTGGERGDFTKFKKSESKGNDGQQMALEDEMGTSTSNLRNQNSPQGWDNAVGRRSDLKHDVEKGNQSKETQPNLVREHFIQEEDDMALRMKGSGPCCVSNSPIKPIEKINAKEDSSNKKVSPDNEGKGLRKGNWKRLAREKGKAHEVEMNA
nr:hypothetical protein CFP56_64374 [Quercus suber]